MCRLSVKSGTYCTTVWRQTPLRYRGKGVKLPEKKSTSYNVTSSQTRSKCPNLQCEPKGSTTGWYKRRCLAEMTKQYGIESGEKNYFNNKNDIGLYISLL